MEATKPPASEIRTGIVVLGMHRSGTSAVTRAINLLGAEAPGESELLVATPANPTGYWESSALTALNDEVLHSLGASWSGPPNFPEGWHRDPRLDSLRQSARSRFQQIFHGRSWVWKDPRTCITLPFWLDCLGVRPVIVLALRNPLEVWRSLERRDGFSKLFSLALWERYARQAVFNAVGYPTVVTRYADLLHRPEEWSRQMHSCLRSWGVLESEAADEAGVLASLRRDLRHAEYEPADFAEDPDVSPSQRQLFSMLEGCVGVHDRFGSYQLGEETPSTESFLAIQRAADLKSRAELQWAECRYRERYRELEELYREQEARSNRELDRLRKEHQGDVARIDDFGGKLPLVENDRDRWKTQAERTQMVLSEIQESRSWKLLQGLRKLRSGRLPKPARRTRSGQ